jgi:hypothetical protein
MVEKGRLTVERIGDLFLVYAETKSVIAVQRGFREDFSARWDAAKSLVCVCTARAVKKGRFTFGMENVVGSKRSASREHGSCESRHAA